MTEPRSSSILAELARLCVNSTKVVTSSRYRQRGIIDRRVDLTRQYSCGLVVGWIDDRTYSTSVPGREQIIRTKVLFPGIRTERNLHPESLCLQDESRIAVC